MTIPLLENATAAEVRSAIRRKLLTEPDGADPLEAVMSIVRPVLEAKDAALAKLRARDREW